MGTAQLGHDGFTPAGRLFDDAQVAAAREAADALLAEHGARSEYGVIALDAWRRAPVFRELLEPLGAAACRLLGVGTVIAFQDLVIDKPPRTGAQTLPWHQDATYLPLDRRDGIVAWAALDDADELRGCLRYVPLHAGEPADDAAFVAEARAGEAWFHSPVTWHCSPPNEGDGHRRAWSVWFVHEDTRWAPERAQHPYLLELRPTAGAPLDPSRFPRVQEGTPLQEGV